MLLLLQQQRQFKDNHNGHLLTGKPADNFTLESILAVLDTCVLTGLRHMFHLSPITILELVELVENSYNALADELLTSFLSTIIMQSLLDSFLLS